MAGSASKSLEDFVRTTLEAIQKGAQGLDGKSLNTKPAMFKVNLNAHAQPTTASHTVGSVEFEIGFPVKAPGGPSAAARKR